MNNCILVQLQDEESPVKSMDYWIPIMGFINSVQSDAFRVVVWFPVKSLLLLWR